jgi:hypothetical protein
VYTVLSIANVGQSRTRAPGERIEEETVEESLSECGIIGQAMHMPRLKQRVGLGYAMSPTGGEHETNVNDTGFGEGGPHLGGVARTGQV